MKGTIIAWLWLSSMFMFGTTNGFSSRRLKDDKWDYPTVTFTTAKRSNYAHFIEKLRDHLGRGKDERHGITVLPNPHTVPVTQRFLLVQLSNPRGHSITIALDVTNVYVVGYRVGNQSYLFQNAPSEASFYLFQDTTRFSIGFESNYDALEAVAGQHRDSINLGTKTPLGRAISLLYNSSGTTSSSQQATSLMVCIQIISEATRFKHVQLGVPWGKLRWVIYHKRSGKPDAMMLSLENNWEALSAAVQQANEAGEFSDNRIIQLQREDDSIINVTRVNGPLVINLAFLLYVCRDPSSSPRKLDAVVLPNDVGGDEVCSHDPEATVHIAGRDGQCVEVRNGDYSDGNQVQLWPCHMNTKPNQIWTLKSDGTIRSKDKCLTVSEYLPAKPVMIYDCNSYNDTEAAHWQLLDDRSIVNPKSGLVLTATSRYGGTALAVDFNIHAASQAWLPTNNPQPYLTYILGVADLCLRVVNESVQLGSQCDRKWALYADSTIRPDQNTENCLSYVPSAQQREDNVNLDSCSQSSNAQRWVFMNDGSIRNLYYKQVLQASGNNPNFRLVRASTFTGNLNQKWLALL
ncbi:hypothetical protein P3X46_015596 [Hevea brasiliensis]|uniref:Ribosome-inactivating protein n=1 Tax=Hevea brasiliensis TaxID=3981 RepID=A0ABQ9LYC3_HEVBR|nr:ricin-like [Hevea brasiliensis]KAJ9172348.1 hypothetical protein P3X46_015596 [Hevea brasiliensis]